MNDIYRMSNQRTPDLQIHMAKAFSMQCVLLNGSRWVWSGWLIGMPSQGWYHR
jgi:hypothetical protein